MPEPCTKNKITKSVKASKWQTTILHLLIDKMIKMNKKLNQETVFLQIYEENQSVIFELLICSYTVKKTL